MTMLAEILAMGITYAKDKLDTTTSYSKNDQAIINECRRLYRQEFSSAPFPMELRYKHENSNAEEGINAEPVAPPQGCYISMCSLPANYFLSQQNNLLGSNALRNVCENVILRIHHYLNQLNNSSRGFHLTGHYGYANDGVRMLFVLIMNACIVFSKVDLNDRKSLDLASCYLSFLIKLRDNNTLNELFMTFSAIDGETPLSVLSKIILDFQKLGEAITAHQKRQRLLTCSQALHNHINTLIRQSFIFSCYILARNEIEQIDTSMEPLPTTQQTLRQPSLAAWHYHLTLILKGADSKVPTPNLPTWSEQAWMKDVKTAGLYMKPDFDSALLTNFLKFGNVLSTLGQLYQGMQVFGALLERGGEIFAALALRRQMKEMLDLLRLVVTNLQATHSHLDTWAENHSSALCQKGSGMEPLERTWRRNYNNLKKQLPLYATICKPFFKELKKMETYLEEGIPNLLNQKNQVHQLTQTLDGTLERVNTSLRRIDPSFVPSPQFTSVTALESTPLQRISHPSPLPVAHQPVQHGTSSIPLLNTLPSIPSLAERTLEKFKGWIEAYQPTQESSREDSMAFLEFWQRLGTLSQAQSCQAFHAQLVAYHRAIKELRFLDIVSESLKDNRPILQDWAKEAIIRLFPISRHSVFTSLATYETMLAQHTQERISNIPYLDYKDAWSSTDYDLLQRYLIQTLHYTPKEAIQLLERDCPALLFPVKSCLVTKDWDDYLSYVFNQWQCAQEGSDMMHYWQVIAQGLLRFGANPLTWMDQQMVNQQNLTAQVQPGFLFSAAHSAFIMSFIEYRAPYLGSSMAYLHNQWPALVNALNQFADRLTKCVTDDNSWWWTISLPILKLIMSEEALQGARRERAIIWWSLVRWTHLILQEATLKELDKDTLTDIMLKADDAIKAAKKAYEDKVPRKSSFYNQGFAAWQALEQAYFTVQTAMRDVEVTRKAHLLASNNIKFKQEADQAQREKEEAQRRTEEYQRGIEEAQRKTEELRGQAMQNVRNMLGKQLTKKFLGLQPPFLNNIVQRYLNAITVKVQDCFGRQFTKEEIETLAREILSQDPRFAAIHSELMANVSSSSHASSPLIANSFFTPFNPNENIPPVIVSANTYAVNQQSNAS